MNAILRLSNFLLVRFWALVILVPRWRWTERIKKSPLVSIGPALVYGTLVPRHLPVIWTVISRSTVDGVAQLLASSAGATIAWVHFLAFDFFVGCWIYLDSGERRIGPVLISPVLFLTLMLGPLGFLLHLSVRLFTQKNTAQDKPEAAALKSSVLASGNQFRTNLLPVFGDWLWRGFALDRPLTILGCVMLLALLGKVLGLISDPRVITGAPVWLKPAKFFISVSVYCFTLVWLLGFLNSSQSTANPRDFSCFRGSTTQGCSMWEATR
jgi:hypothetical protein